MRRRKLLKATGALFATGSIGTASATRNESTGLQTVGLRDQVIELIQAGRVEQAKRIMDAHDVEYEINSGPVRTNDAQSNGISTQGRYVNNADYDVGILSHGAGDDLYYAFGNIIFKDRRYRLKDASVVDDGMALVWADSDWTGHQPDEDGVDYWSDNVADSVDHEDYIPGDGVAGSVELDRDYPGGNVGMGVTIEKIRDDADAVQFEYEHTWAYASRSINVGICYGGLCVSTPLNVSTAWRNEEAAYL